jgi:hypothetical protein
MATDDELRLAESLYKQLVERERVTREEARFQFAHPDDEDFDDKIAGGAERYPTIITQVGRWAITAYGLECLNVGYSINAARLNEDDWIDHMSEKMWVDDLEDFATALYHARAIHAILPKIIEFHVRRAAR